MKKIICPICGREVEINKVHHENNITFLEVVPNFSTYNIKCECGLCISESTEEEVLQDIKGIQETPSNNGIDRLLGFMLSKKQGRLLSRKELIKWVLKNVM